MNSIKNLTPIQVSVATHLLFLSFGLGLTVLLPKTKKKLEPISVKVIEIQKQVDVTPAINIANTPKPPESQIQEEPPPVFGLTQKTLTSTGSTVSVKLGNTLAKDIDQVEDDGSQSLPKPVDEYLISKMPKVLNEVRVAYPPEARRLGITGAVIVDLLIDSSGAVLEATLVKGLNDELDSLAVAALKKFKFQPAFVGDVAVAVKIRYSYRFTLE